LLEQTLARIERSCSTAFALIHFIRRLNGIAAGDEMQRYNHESTENVSLGKAPVGNRKCGLRHLTQHCW
jgi:hypothetical protein